MDVAFLSLVLGQQRVRDSCYFLGLLSIKFTLKQCGTTTKPFVSLLSLLLKCLNHRLVSPVHLKAHLSKESILMRFVRWIANHPRTPYSPHSKNEILDTPKTCFCVLLPCTHASSNPVTGNCQFDFCSYNCVFSKMSHKWNYRLWI